MVATKWAGSRAVAGLLALSFLLSALVVPTAVAQGVDSPYVQGGGVYITEGDATRVRFSNASLVTPHVIVKNDRLTTLGPLAVYAYITTDEGALPAGESGAGNTQCKVVTIPAATQADGQAVPGSIDVAFSPVSSNLWASGGYDVNIEVNPTTAPNGVTSCQAFSPFASSRTATGFFVRGFYLDLHIDAFSWCLGNAKAGESCAPFGDGTRDSRMPDETLATYFRAELSNDGTWTSVIDNGSAQNAADRKTFPYNVSFSVSGPGLSTPLVIASKLQDGNFVFLSESFDLAGRAGAYTVTAAITQSVRQAASADDTRILAANVRAPQYHVTFNATDFKTTPEDPYRNESFFIKGDMAIHNDGDSNVTFSAISVLVYLDDASNSANVLRTITIPAGGLKAGETRYYTLNERRVLTGTNEDITPGKHTLFVMADSGLDAFETDETDNLGKLDIYVVDSKAPEFVTGDKPRVQIVGAGGPERPHATVVHPAQRIRIHANVSDDDTANLDVKANVSLIADPSVFHVYNLTQATATRWSVLITDFDFAGDNFSQAEEWRIIVNATDATGNKATSSANNFTLHPWPVHTLPAESIYLELPTDIPWAGSAAPRWRLYLPATWTGVPLDDRSEDFSPEGDWLTNVDLYITNPQNATEAYLDGSGFQPQVDCPPASVTAGATGSTDDACTEQDQHRFTGAKGSRDSGGPGLYNYTLRIRDAAGHNRTLNATYRIVDEVPTVIDFHLPAATADPGEKVTVFANFSDDFRVEQAFANFTRQSDDHRVNFTFIDLQYAPVSGDEPQTVRAVLNVTTGAGSMFGVAGTYSLFLEATDQAHNWVRVDAGTFTLNDSRPPQILAAGPLNTRQETGENVTFFAETFDDTNVTVTLTILRGSERILEPFTMTANVSGNHTHRLNFSTPGDYDWTIRVIDSVGVETTKRGVLIVRDNLGPRFDIRSPSNVIAAVRYAPAAPHIEILVIDTDGVDTSSIRMHVDGEAVALEEGSIVAAAGSQEGYLVTYVVPAGRAFPHNKLVNVSLFAVDLSNNTLNATLDFSFVVDDKAPTTSIVGISPSYRDQSAHTLNISSSSLITLEAADDDGLGTRVASIRYQISGTTAGKSAQTIYNGPFSLNDIEGIIVAPGIYRLEYWSVDDVGNAQRVGSVELLQLDNQAPTLFDFESNIPRLSADFQDDLTGVDRVVAWVSHNDEAYQAVDFTFEDGFWVASLPAGARGDTVRYYLQAWDNVGNTVRLGNETSPYRRYEVDNTRPTLSLTAPQEGARVGGAVRFTWTADDADRDPLTFEMDYRAPGKAEWIELQRFESPGQRQFNFDTTTLPDGEYTFRLRASDGTSVAEESIRLILLNRVQPVGTVTPVNGKVLPGDTVLVKAEISKSQALVEARLYLDGKLVDAFPMNDEGRDGDEVAADGIFSVRVPVDQAGDYRVDIFTQYREDGQEKQSVESGALEFTSNLTPGYVLSEYGLIIAIVVLLGLAAIGAAGFVMVRRKP